MNLGKYNYPKTLEKITKLQEQLNEEGLLEYGDLLGQYFSDDSLRYLNTPLDLIPFASPGSDGIHYGFLTDFGQVKSLEDAYIIRVSPMDFDDPVKIVARNLHDFLRLLCYWPYAVEFLDITSTNKEIKRYIDEDIVEDEQYNRVKDIIQKTFKLEPIESLYDYFQAVKQEREQSIEIPTEEGIGIVCQKLIKKPKLFKLTRDQTITVKEVKHFFKTSSYEAKLAFLRDAQSKGILFDNEEVKPYLKEQLVLLRLDDEANRI